MAAPDPDRTPPRPRRTRPLQAGRDAPAEPSPPETPSEPPSGSPSESPSTRRPPARGEALREPSRLSSRRPPRETPELDAILAAAPGVARIATSAVRQVTEWAVSTTLDTGAAAARAARDGQPAAKVVGDAIATVRANAGQLLGTRAVGSLPEPAEPTDPEEALRSRGAALLARSADVSYDEASHPAYEHIIDDLAPDEARILRLLYVDGPQPSVDVRSASPLPNSSELLAPGITMIANHAGCRHADRVPRYLNNLQRLGLIWFSREPLEDLARYQVLEAQPEVLEIMGGAKRAKTVRRSINLTPFGTDFCEVCLPVPPRSD